PRQFSPQVAWPGVAPVEQPRLEPAVEVLHAAIELRLAGRDEDRPDAEPQAEPDDPRPVPRRRTPTGQLAGVVELDLLADAQGLQLGAEGRSPNQTVASGRRGVGLEPAADGADGPLQLGRDALGDVMVGPCPIVEGLGARLDVAAPPLVEPSLGAAQRRADGLDGPAGEAETDGALTRRKFVVHAVLRGAAAGAFPRGTFSTQPMAGSVTELQVGAWDPPPISK